MPNVTIEVRDEWLVEVADAIGEDGSNDAEHDLLIEISEQISAALPEERRRVERITKMREIRALAREMKDEGLTEPGDVIEDVASWEVAD